MTSPRISATSGTLVNCTPSIKVDWSQEEEASKRVGNQCSSQQWTRWTTIKIWKKSNTIQTNPKSQCTKILGELTKIQYTGAIWSSLKGKDRSFVTLDHIQSLFSSHRLRFVLRKWFVWRLERVFLQGFSIPKVTARCTCAKFSIWRSGSAWSQCEKIHRPSKRTKRVQGNLSR